MMRAPVSWGNTPTLATCFQKKCGNALSKRSKAFCHRRRQPRGLSDKVVAVTFTHLARHPLVRFRVVHELLFFRIPLQLSAQAHRDHTEVAHRGRAMPDFRIAD